ncbi:PREDICTED: cleavage stimulation factor subunit 2 tau variant-like [Myotis brandtii]|uniref:cleavage stimulation factor subunit 2 tau variant-like n=1 Tax=Myotis brandtii TaxID=109478 RepID=UPI0003BBE905|nr:PREDICTED: cleavage stimulation factor subunit 2 tau variant-like [Myotis brandtii]
MSSMSVRDPAMDRSLRSVFVGNIPYEATEEQLKDIFSEVGSVVSFRLVYDRETGKPKGYGFCEYQDQETALSAMRNLNGREFSGRALRVDNAASEKDKEELKSLGPVAPIIDSPYGDPIEPEDAPESITRAVASLPPEQMLELMKQMKLCVQNSPQEARTMLLQNPQLAYALLQVQVVMKIIDPETALKILHRKIHVTPLIAGKSQRVSGPVAGLVGRALRVDNAASEKDKEELKSLGPGAGMQGPGMQGAGMQGPGMQGAGMQGPGMQGAGMQGPGMQGAGMQGPGMQGAGMQGPGMQGAGMQGPGMQGAGMQGPGMQGAGMQGPGMQGAGMQGPGMQGAGMQGPGMQGAGMQGPGMQGAGMQGPGMQGAGMQGPGMQGAGMQGPGMQGAGMQGPGMQGAGMQGPGMQGAGMQGPGMQGAGMQGPGMQGAGMQGPGMQGAGMQGPGMQGGGMQGAGMQGTGVQGASKQSGGQPSSFSPGQSQVTPQDQEKAALIMQVLQLTADQIAMLPPEQRQSILILKEQIQKSTGGS